jgi:hypothetical protein
MKEVLSLVAFGIWALFFVVFFVTLKPDIVIAGPGPNAHGYCDTKASPTLACRSLILAAAMWPDVGRR